MKTLVVMAAGLGSRFGGLKQLEPVGPNKEFIIDYSVYDAIRVGFTKVVFIIKRELEEQFKKTIGKRIEKVIDVSYVYQDIGNIPTKQYLAKKRVKPWGTMQAILAAKDEVSGDFLVINADDFYGIDSFRKASAFLDSSTDEFEYACITYPFVSVSSPNGSVKRGVCYLDQGYITKIIESKVEIINNVAYAKSLINDREFTIPLDQPVSMNMFAFKNSCFKLLEESFLEYFKQDDEIILNSEALLSDFIQQKLEQKEITLLNVTSNGLWLGMTYKEDLEDVVQKIKELIRKGEYEEKLWKKI